MMSPPLLPTERLSLSPMTCFYYDFHAITGAGSTASTAWPVANLALYTPLLIPRPVTANQIWVGNGATASGNLDMGVYTEGGSQLYHTGSTAQSGTSAPQAVTITGGLFLPRGRYYLALVLDNGTGTVHRWTGTTNATAALQLFIGMGQQATAFPLPATATFASAAQSFTPLLGLYLSTLTM